jgi:peptidoglycan/xylan/chitin deacetylase (PgdA/CDA1 family)
METRGRKVVVVLSSDTEFDPPEDSIRWNDRSTRSLLDGLPRLIELCNDFDATVTLFCEGKLVQSMPELFKELSRRHEIGCHSFAHEWLGVRPPPNWIPHREELPVLSTDAKVELLKGAIEVTEKAIGRRPQSFKAPFNSIDSPSTFRILDEVGFSVDSSLASYNTNSFVHPINPTPTRHTSTQDLWTEGKMHLIELPFTIRPRPLALHPFNVREALTQTISRSMRLALETVDMQCRIDVLSGRDLSVVHFASHPWEFSEIPPWGGNGRENAENLADFLHALLDTYDVEFMTVKDFVSRWENDACTFHRQVSDKTPILEEEQH